MTELSHDQRLKRIRRIYAMLANVIPYSWIDDPKVEREELRGLCEALTGIERALGLKRTSVSEPFWMQDVRVAQRRIDAQRRAIARPRPDQPK